MVALNRRFYSVFNKGINFLKKNGGISGFLVEGHERFWKINNSIKINLNTILKTLSGQL